MKYYVEIISHETGEIVKRIDCGNSIRKADRVKGGVDINLNHDEYWTDIIEEESEEVRG